MKYFLDNGWFVKMDDSKTPKLFITPIQNSIFNKSMVVDISNDLFDVISSGETRVDYLFKNHNLHNVIFQWDSRPMQKSILPEDTKNLFYGHGWQLEKRSNEFYFEFIKAAHGGGGRRIIIDEKTFDAIKAKGKNQKVSEILEIFDLKKYDIPENDV